MLYRKDFLKKSAILIGSFAGVNHIVMLTGPLFAEESVPDTLQSYFAFADADDLNRVMNEIDSFGDPGEGRIISSKIFTPGMELLKFAELYCEETVKRYNTKPDKNNAFDGIAVSRECDAYMELIESLLKMIGNTVFEFHVKAMRCAITDGQTEILQTRGHDIYSAIQLIVKKWRSGSLYFSGKIKTESANIILTTGTKYRKEYPLSELGLTGIENISPKFSHPFSAENFIGIKQNFNSNLSHARYLCKAIFSRYALLNAFEKYYMLLSKDKEKLTNNNEITSGARQFIAKTLCAILFLELTITRMRLIATRSRSGIFTASDREMFQMEFANLIDTVKDITMRPAFADKLIFAGVFAAKPVKLNSDGIKGEITVGAFNISNLGIRDAGGRDSITISTPYASDKAVMLLDEALKKLKVQREKLKGGIRK